MDILALPFGKMLVLGAISAASAFIVTMLLVLVCVGCRKKTKSKHNHSSVESQKRDRGVLQQSKIKSMSKSDTRLHEMCRLPYTVNGVPTVRPASMDLLLLQSHDSTFDLHPPIQNCHLPHTPTGPESEKHENLFPEDDGLYERVGVFRAPPPAPLLNSLKSQTISENRERAGGELEGSRLNEAQQAEVMPEYASVRKVRKLEQGRRKEEEENTSLESSNRAFHVKEMEPSHIPNFSKEAMPMGNGEEYIWKPPEDSNIVVWKGLLLENGHVIASKTEITETYSTICKPLKKKLVRSTQQISEEIECGEESSMGPISMPSEEHCYEPVRENAWSKVLDSDPPYATINPMQKREMLCSSTVKPNMSCGPMQGPEKTMNCENFYESIGDVKHGTNTSSSTTIFTFNDGMEMYITGL
ncbi:lck-interacting transmembrane adapter 1 isoform X2 [Silurus meridionalis]|uniref:lck-interacting transmembrane adapter 1 isoform X2 n=1 Tax=Silurus meridionalis TaxID=175797 RepID=UPI001EEBB088|nr:lck-interacting transmembrane adapter 1 isoform X2 [Silurus meridionalis]